MRPDEGYIQMVSLVSRTRHWRYLFFPYPNSRLLGVRCQGYTSDPPLPEVRAANREFADWKKDQKDAEKRRQERKRKDKDAREKENRAREKQGKSPIPTPNSTPEKESSASAEVEVDYSALPDPNTEGVEGQSPG